MFVTENYNDTDALKLYMSNVIRIPLLSEEKERKLLEEYSKGDLKARNRLVEANLRLVVTIANETKRILSTTIPVLDLIQAGNIGLMKAIENFDLTKENRLSTYASFVIRTHIQQYIYNNSTTFKTSIEFVRAARAFYHKLDKLQSKTGKTYTTTELAEMFNIDEATIIQYFQFSTNHVSLDEKIGETEDTIANFVIDEKNVDPEEDVIDKEINKILLEEIQTNLSPKEKDVILMRYGFTDGEYHTLDEVGKVYGVTRERIRQIEKRALKRLKNPVKTKCLR